MSSVYNLQSHLLSLLQRKWIVDFGLSFDEHTFGLKIFIDGIHTIFSADA